MLCVMLLTYLNFNIVQEISSGIFPITWYLFWQVTFSRPDNKYYVFLDKAFGIAIDNQYNIDLD